MEDKNMNKKHGEGCSRRKFLRRAGIVTGGAALVAGSAFASSDMIEQRKVAACTETTSEFIGEMVCTTCGKKASHPRGLPARMMKCPECEGAMARSVDEADC